MPKKVFEAAVKSIKAASSVSWDKDRGTEMTEAEESMRVIFFKKSQKVYLQTLLLRAL